MQYVLNRDNGSLNGILVYNQTRKEQRAYLDERFSCVIQTSHIGYVDLLFRKSFCKSKISKNYVRVDKDCVNHDCSR
jgi:hypothetical protein